MKANSRISENNREWNRRSLKATIPKPEEEDIALKLGFHLFEEGETRLGWLLTFSSSSWEDHDTGNVRSCIDMYFVTQDGSYFKCKYKFRPYFYVGTKEKKEMEVDAFLRRRFEGQVVNVKVVEKEDLILKNHLSGIRKSYLKLYFDTVQQLNQAKNDMMRVVERNKAKLDAADTYETLLSGKPRHKPQDFIDCINDVREYDVPYHVRFAIDNDVRCGQWYDVSVSSVGVSLQKRVDMLQRAEVTVCAFDIETTKLPLKFPDAEYDLIMMISYMVNGRGYLLINRECVFEDISDLEYTPKPEFEGIFKVTNLKNEEELLKTWFSHMRLLRPGIYVTYNGDFFDWPFIEKRAEVHGIKMNEEIGFSMDNVQGECRAKFACHLDCFAWVKRDSYLPQGSQGLKAVTKAKLGYDPLEVNPEDMVNFAKERPQMMASYSVSDAVATYYLYMTYVHPFIFSLATIIPMLPDEVLRKGSGTLCEMLLVVEAHKANVICPNKHQSDQEKFYKNRLLESETYIGGHVECLETGVFRSDIPTSFRLDPSAYAELITNLDRDLEYAIKVEGKMELDSVSNFTEVKNSILEKLQSLQNVQIHEDFPLIYHLDVAAMYPNIILTNRLQPPSIVSDEICTACDFNRPGKTCLRKLEWVWRGETYMANKNDYNHLKRQMESEFVGGSGASPKPFLELPRPEQQLKLKDRLKNYCQKAYRRVMEKPVTELRVAGVCMRENPFYVDTVRSFRDRRYEYKGLNKVWKGKLSEAKADGNPMKIQEAQDMVVLYDSLQLAHKCILNSFYGYVMRKGARWYSMEMAGVVTYTGAKIIQNARLLVERIGKPLELDTDGIWCALPGSFPENFTFKTRDGDRKMTISYPCVILNVEVAKNNTNDQYQTLVDPLRKTYESHSECSIEFEVDGPYKAMILPASKEEGILLKKRYAVFNDDGTLAELKGFEIKRRGELKLIKVFQAELFDKFLHGSTLEECYAAVASVANRWLDLLDNQGQDIADSELIDYISESSTMSKSLADYGEQKSCAVTTARRLADFLGDSMVKDKGLRCQYIVACEPRGLPVSARAVPVAIFETDAEILRFYVRKWCKISSDVGVRSIIDWSYYKQRLSSAIQKIITIPAAMQKVANPVPRVVHPDWLHKKVREMEEKFHQKKLVDIFGTFNKKAVKQRRGAVQTVTMVEEDKTPDLEDIGMKKTAGNIVSGEEIQERDDVSMAPDLTVSIESTDKSVNYGGWLAEQKRKWKVARERRRTRQRLTYSYESHQNSIPGTAANLNQLKGRAGVNSYFKRPESSIINSHWQIIQLVSGSCPGRFYAWVVCEGSMLKVPVTVPRVFYLNSRAPVTEDFPGRCVTKTLPHGHICHNLIEIIVEEEQFITESKKLAAHLMDPEEVEGAYEMKIPLEFNTVVQIGCVCKVDGGAKKRNIQEGWNLRELCMKTTTEFSYLENSIGFIYLYSSTSDNRALYVLYFSESKTVHVVVVNPFLNKEISASIVEKLFYDCYRPGSRRDFVFKVEYVGHIENADKFVQRALVYHRGEHQGPALVAIQCHDTHLTKSRITALHDLPCVTVPFNAHDCQYRAVGWQIVASKVGIQRCAASFQWLSERIALSRYAHVPLGNFENVDPLMYTCDVFFARALRDQQHLLWVSDNGVPDLGGGGGGCGGGGTEEDTSFADEVHQPGVNNPGAYRKVAVEVKVHHISVIALLQSHVVNEIWGGDDSFGLDQNAHCGFDEAIACGPAFRVLKQLISRCMADALGNGNIFADVISHRLYQWICSPRSKHHDPALHRTLHKVMQKVFALLLMECKKMGASVIFANFSKIILDTGRLDLDSAKAYCDSLIRTIQSSDLFEWISLEPEHFWHSLIFMDQYNFGGTRALTRLPFESSDDHTTEEDMGDGAQVDVISNWHIAERLPKFIQEQFILIVSEFIHLPWKDLQEKQGSGDGVTAAAEKVEGMVGYLKEKVGSYFTSKILRIVQGLEKHKGDGSLSLEFIKKVCAVIGLDEAVRHDVMVMRRNLLKYVRVREFSAEAELADSCSSFVLPNVSCGYCHDCRDVDLCRDVACLEEEWRCPVPQCGHPYDREAMENALLQIVRQRERVYHVQDVVCVKCGEVKAVHLNDQCRCGGLYKCKEEASEFLVKMKVFLDIAQRQKFVILNECITWILGR